VCENKRWKPDLTFSKLKFKYLSPKLSFPLFTYSLLLKKASLFLFFLLFKQVAFSQSPRLFSINRYEEAGKSAFCFFSLSDLVFWDSDTLPFPFPDISEWPNDSSYKFLLPQTTRTGLFKLAGISENDKVWIYDYASNHLLSFPVKTLPMVALLNPYDNWEKGRFEPRDYMLGFQLELKQMPPNKDNYFTSLVAIGKSNPFNNQGLHKVQWKAIQADQFPSAGNPMPLFWAKDATLTGTFSSNYSNFQVYVQTLQKQTSNCYHYVVLTKSTAELIEDFYVQSSEGCEPAPLNLVDSYGRIGDQWIGSLIKRQPPVLLGLEYFSFSCPTIHVLKKGAEAWWILCDCRH
jgi:hypothetical protein